jgi:hypothetical protein
VKNCSININSLKLHFVGKLNIIYKKVKREYYDDVREYELYTNYAKIQRRIKQNRSKNQDPVVTSKIT